MELLGGYHSFVRNIEMIIKDTRFRSSHPGVFSGWVFFCKFAAFFFETPIQLNIYGGLRLYSVKANLLHEIEFILPT